MMEFESILSIEKLLTAEKPVTGDKRSILIENVNTIALVSKRLNERTYQLSDMSGSVNVTIQGCGAPSNFKVKEKITTFISYKLKFYYRWGKLLKFSI